MLAVAGVVAVTATRDEPSAPVVTPPSVTAVDRMQACERFRDRVGSLTALLDDVSTEDGATSLGEAVTALDALAADLTAAGAGDGDLDDFDAIRGGVRQASLHAAKGDANAAITPLEFARRTYDASALSRDGCLG